MRQPGAEKEAATRSVFLALLIATALSSGCTTTVNLTLMNVEPFAQTAKVVVQKDDWEVARVIEAGKIDGGAQKQLDPFPVDNGARFLVESSLPGSGTLFVKSTKVHGDRDPFPVTMELRHQSGTLLDDHHAAAKLLAALATVAPGAGAYPMSLEDALQKKLGSMVIVDEGAGGAPKEIFSLSGEQFAVPAAAERDLAVGRTEVDEITVSAAALSSVAKESPFYRFLAGPVDAGDICRVRWVFQGCGVVTERRDDAEVSAAFDALSDVVKAQIKDILELNKEAKLYFLNGAYVVRQARLTAEYGRKLPVGTKVDLDDIIAPSGIYRFGVEPERAREFRDLVVYLVGEEVEVLLVPRPAEVAMTFPAEDGPLVTTSVAFDITAHLSGRKRMILPQHLNAAMAKER